MAADRYLSVAREGWPFILTTAAAAALVQHYYGLSWAIPLWASAAFLAYLFRDPERLIPASPLALVSPSDGVVLAVETGRDPYLDREAVVVRIGISALGSFSTRSPVEAKVMQRWHGSVTLQGAAPPGHGVWLQTDEGDNVVLVMRPGARLGQPRCPVQPGERVGQGQRCGFMPFGSQIEVYMPANSRVDIVPGTRVRAGTDALAKLVHK